jgi:hypothetical protein
MLDPFRHGLFAWQLASHKLCRWLVPFAMVVALTSNALLVSRSWLYPATMAIQCAFYAAAAAGLWTRAPRLRIPAYLLVANFAVLTAWRRFARGERVSTWNPSSRLAALPQIGAR